MIGEDYKELKSIFEEQSTYKKKRKCEKRKKN